jgi:hypothetical protein
VAVVPAGNRPDNFTPSTGGMSMDDGWPEHRGFRFDSADAPTHHRDH